MEQRMAEHIVAVFETEAAAAAATQSLQSAGIPLSAIRQYAGPGRGGHEIEPAAQTSTHPSGGGFWAWLFGEESTSETTRSAYTHDTYDRRASAGNVVLTVTVDDDAKIHQAITALEAHHPIDIDERSDEDPHMASSTTPMTGPSTTGRDFSSGEVAQAGMTDTTLPAGRVGTTDAPAMPVASGTTSTSNFSETASPATATSPTAAYNGPTGTEKSDQVVSLSEEQLEIGKRTVDRGTTRIRRYVVEKPVEESVTLRGERVIVEKRQPIETATPGAGAFEERVVEVRETAEEPVLAKTARVVEEVVVGREATERAETVRDTVRREEVEVSKDGEVKR
jgi:uncharacterized protein (TIGR02271 family)